MAKPKIKAATMSMFKKILIANRGEIAVRIIQTAKKLGIKTLVVYAGDDASSMHVSLADEAVLLEGNTLLDTYLNQDKIIGIALNHGAEAIHPGYGFLSENATFAQKTEKAGLRFIGATAGQIRLMGEKIQANKMVRELGIPVIPSLTGTPEEILSQQNRLDFPLLVKASGGGGGKGIEVVHEPGTLAEALETARRKARQYFDSEGLLVEKYLPEVRHIEVQIMGDGKGKVVHLFERECSIQRHYQKMIEEAPASALPNAVKEKLYQAALKIGHSIEYRGAGTIEFLVDKEMNFYFLEMNTRLQVEHPVTESITGIDLVEWQLRIAAGEKLVLDQKNIRAHGNAIELRICAEDPDHDFRPTPGIISKLQLPRKVRWDSFIQPGITISSSYDSLLGKIITVGKNREEAIQKAEKALTGFFIPGIQTNQQFLHRLVARKEFSANTIFTRWVENHKGEILQSIKSPMQQATADPFLAAYLLHHFYRPSTEKSPWKRKGYYRLHQAFQVLLNEEIHELTVLNQSTGLSVFRNNKESTLIPCSFSNQKLVFKLNEKKITAFIHESENGVSVQINSIPVMMRSNHLLNQVKHELKTRHSVNGQKAGKVVAGLYGKVLEIFVKPGEALKEGQDILVIESMKSEITIKSPVDAHIKTVKVTRGETVKDDHTLVEFES